MLENLVLDRRTLSFERFEHGTSFLAMSVSLPWLSRSTLKFHLAVKLILGAIPLQSSAEQNMVPSNLA